VGWEIDFRLPLDGLHDFGRKRENMEMCMVDPTGHPSTGYTMFKEIEVRSELFTEALQDKANAAGQRRVWCHR